MSTAEGLPEVKEVRKAVEALEERRLFITKRLLLKVLTRWPTFGARTSYEVKEIKALDLAIPLLEDHWGYVARMDRQVRYWESDKGQGGPRRGIRQSEESNVLREAAESPKLRVRHGGLETEFCALCLSGEHERVD